MGKLIRRVILEAIIQHLGKYNSFFTLYKRMDIYLNHALIYVCVVDFNAVLLKLLYKSP